MRLEGWERRLQNYLANVGPFVWGQTDCCMFSFGVVNELTGRDLRKQYKHKTAQGAAKILAKIGGIEAGITSHFGEPKPPTQAKRGDLVSFETGNGIGIGVCIGAKIAAMQEGGLTFLPMSHAQRAWSV